MPTSFFTSRRQSWVSARALLLSLGLWAGLLSVVAEESSLILAGDSWRFFRGKREPAAEGEDWRVAGFNDAAWEAGPTGVGYGNNDDATSLLDMAYIYSSVYLRKVFTLQEPADIRRLTLRLDYQDGVCVYLNGTEVLRLNLNGEPGSFIPFDARAVAAKSAGTAEEFDLTPFRDLLVQGQNVLAIQLHDDVTPSFGLSLVPELLANFTRGPFVQNAGSTSMGVVWKTHAPTTGQVEFGLTEALGQTLADGTLSTNHAVLLTGLAADTTYRYRVRASDGEETAVSDIHTFRTLKSAGPIRFALTADTGSGLRPQLNIARLLRDLRPDLVMHSGDVVYPLFTDGLADIHCMSIYQRHMRETPYFFAFGNHDLYAGESPYLRTFFLPTNQVTGAEHYYSFDHGDAHFVVLYQPMLNQYLLSPEGAQYAWLRADLAATAKPWKLIFLHLPLMTSAHHRYDDANLNGLLDTDEVRDVLLPVAREHGVQLIVSGHAHVYERFAPVDGVHTLISGAGGGSLYAFVGRDRASAQFASRYHAVLVTIEGDVLQYEAFDENGGRFDRATIRRAPAPAGTYQAAWHTPAPPPAAAEVDGNLPGERFDVAGEAIPSMSGDFSNPGFLRADLDRTYLHLGIEQMMVYPDSDVFLFLEVPGLPGVTNLVGLGNGLVDPVDEGVDGLDFLENLGFTNFRPAIACVLGDEYADRTDRSFLRPGTTFAAGQGVFRLQPSFPSVPGASLRQFNRSPEGPGEVGEQNADFVTVSIPVSELGPLQPGQVVRVGLVVGGYLVDTNLAVQARWVDRSYVGAALHGNGLGPVQLEGLSVQLPPDPDPDRDGVTTEDEQRLGLDPFNPDTDGDGLLDGWEIAHGLNPLSLPGEGEGAQDVDGDGLTNEQEQVFGADPRRADSGLRVEVSLLEGGGVRLSWPARPGWRFNLQAASEPDLPFEDLEGGGFPRAALSDHETFDLSPADLQGTEARFFRLQFLP